MLSLLSRCMYLTLTDAHCASYCEQSMLILIYYVVVLLKSHKYYISASFSVLTEYLSQMVIIFCTEVMPWCYK